MIDSRLLTGRFFIAEECMSEQEALSLLEAILTQFPNTSPALPVTISV